MKTAKVFFTLIMMSLAFQAEARDCISFSVQGEDSFGPYEGEIQIKENKKAYRHVIYKNQWQEKFSVEALWEGRSETNNRVSFKVKNHLFLSEVNEVAVNKEEFQSSKTVIINTQDLKKNQSCTNITDLQNRRKKQLIQQGYPNPFLVRLAKFIAVDPIINFFRKHPFLAPYQNHPDFKNPRYYVVDDLTDLKFYRSNPNTLRLRNVSINEFTLTEAQLKNSAFSLPLDEKAEIMDKHTAEQNINSLGLFHHIINGHSYPDGDSALWTGMYVASQGAKYLATGDTLALQRAEKSIEGLLLLLEVSGNPREFARGVMPKNDKTHVGDNWKLGTGPYNEVYWLPGGNNDMIKGLILGLIWGYKIIPHHSPLFEKMRQGVDKLQDVKLKRLNGLNQSYLAGLEALFNNSPDAYAEFVKTYLPKQNALELLGLNRQFYFQGVADWSGINLSTVAALSFYLISDEIIKKWPQLPKSLSADDQIPDYSRDAQFIKKQQKKTIYELNQVFKYAKRDFVCLMNHSLNRELGPAPESCFRSFIETPAQIPEISLGYDNRIKENFTYGASPYLPWKFIGKKNRIIPDGLSGNQMLPMYEADAFSSQMMWKESFGIHDRKAHGAQVPRIDYLFSYWTYQMFQRHP